MASPFLAKAKTAALLPFAIGASLFQAGCSLVSKNGGLSENSILYVAGVLLGSMLYCVGDIMHNHLVAARITRRNSAVKKLERLEKESGCQSQSAISGPYASPKKNAEEPVQHDADKYKSWYDIPGKAKTRMDWGQAQQFGKDSREISFPAFRAWNTDANWRKFTGSFGKDAPPVFYKTMADASVQRNGAQAKVLWR